MPRLGVLILAAGLWAAGCAGSVDTREPGASAGPSSGAAGQASDASLDSAGDGGQPPCGDPVALARYASCSKATDKASCEESGGSWGAIGFAPYEECQCLTGQQACTCTGRDGCLGPCIAEPVNGVMDCTGVTAGHCSPVRITLGCWCFFDEQGGVQGICID